MRFDSTKAETLYWRPQAVCRKAHTERSWRNQAWEVVDGDGTVIGYSGNALGAWNDAAARVGWQSIRGNTRRAIGCEHATTHQLAVDQLRATGRADLAESLERYRTRRYGDY